MGGLGGADAWGLLPLDSREQICCRPLLSTHTHVHGHGSRTHPDSQAWRPVDFLLSEHGKGTSDSSVFAFAPPVGPGKAGTWLYSCGSFEPCRFQRPASPPGPENPQVQVGVRHRRTWCPVHRGFIRDQPADLALWEQSAAVRSGAARGLRVGPRACWDGVYTQAVLLPFH